VFGFGRKKEDPNRKAFREEFESTTKKLRTAPEESQMALGHAVNLAHSLFAQRFDSPEAFRSAPSQVRHDYIAKLTVMEDKLREEKDDPAGSLGFGLFKMWVGALSAGDSELIEQFSSELAYFSRKGNFDG